MSKCQDWNGWNWIGFRIFIEMKVEEETCVFDRQIGAAHGR
jgi:hypothetical protein